MPGPADALVSDLASLVTPGAEPTEEDDFEALFSRLAELRAAAARLPAGQRHDYAERVATAFLRSLGGDEDDRGQDSD